MMMTTDEYDNLMNTLYEEIEFWTEECAEDFIKRYRVENEEDYCSARDDLERFCIGLIDQIAVALELDIFHS